jgi:hypothetical protein
MRQVCTRPAASPSTQEAAKGSGKRANGLTFFNSEMEAVGD